jgi:tRNA modification GTPase
MDLHRLDTICALATPSGTAALAIIRVSGVDAMLVHERVFVARHGSARVMRMATLGDIIDGQRQVIDEVLCTCFAAGHSYTGESSFEVTVHGSMRIVAAVLQVLQTAGCRLAEPGEFTLRAVLTGTMNLLEAEAVDDVIHASSERSARIAQQQLRGSLSDQVTPVRDALVSVLAELEARLDFPDEELGAAAMAALAASIASVRQKTSWWTARGQLGRRTQEGVRVVLYGPPNAGKSTLLNALSGESRALVHDVPGTTRDVLEMHLQWDGVAVILIDVAGIRDMSVASAVEQMGIVRAEAERQRADVVVGMVGRDQCDALSVLRGMDVDIRVLSKQDLAPDMDDADVLHVSSGNERSLSSLRTAIVAHAMGSAGASDDALLMRERQRRCAKDADDALIMAETAMADRVGHEVVASELRRAAKSLDRLLGRDINQDVLDVVFSRFCIGK